MSETTVGRAGFHARHTKAVGERRAIVHEMMRELDEDSIAYWAARNPNIVVADETLNEAMVNDGHGGFTRCTDREQVIAYGDSRDARLTSPLRTDKPDKGGKMRGGTVTTSMLVSHLPKSMCEEIPDYYPRLNENGHPLIDKATGEPMTRSRWVARDRVEARRYFEDVIEYLGENVLPGGKDAIHGYDIQFSESTPHVQILADPYGADPKSTSDEKDLRADASRAWFSHRDVRNEKGQQVSGPAKLRAYHDGLKRHLIAKGYDISPDFDKERHMVGHTKADYERVQDARATLKGRETAVREDFHELKGRERHVSEREQRLDDREQELVRREQRLTEQEAELPRRRRAAAEAGAQDSEAELAEVAAHREQARQAAEDAARRARDQQLGRWLREHHPDVLSEYEDSLTPPRGPRLLRPLRVSGPMDRELHEVMVAHLGHTKTGQPVVRTELDARDPLAAGQTGLLVSGWRGRDAQLIEHLPVTPELLDEVRDTAGDSQLVDDRGRPAYSVRARLRPSSRSGALALVPGSVRPSGLALPPSWQQWHQQQQDAEEAAQASWGSHSAPRHSLDPQGSLEDPQPGL